MTEYDDFPQLTKPHAGYMFVVCGRVIHINFARALVWAYDVRTTTRKRRIRQFLTVSHIIDSIAGKATEIVIGPIKIMIGKINDKQNS